MRITQDITILFNQYFSRTITITCRKFIYSNICTRSNKRTHPSADRNSQPIADAIRTQLDLNTPGLQLLEISSGTGQHAAFLAPRFPNITFQTSEHDLLHFESICAYVADCETKNMRDPLLIDISKEVAVTPLAKLDPQSYEYMFNSNMMHITPWACSVGLFRAAGYLLKPRGRLFTYGPYAVDGVLRPSSNVNFDISLKSQNPDWGVRDIVHLKELAEANGMHLHLVQDLPSNNKFLTWEKRARDETDLADQIAPTDLTVPRASK